MNNTNNPFLKKRTNPFANQETTKEFDDETKKAENSVSVDEISNTKEPEEIKVDDTVVVKPQQTKQSPKNNTKNNSKNSKKYYSIDDVQGRKKYTATMDEQLRRQVKVICARRGMMFSEFVELACREKIEREGE